MRTVYRLIRLVFWLFALPLLAIAFAGMMAFVRLSAFVDAIHGERDDGH